MRKRTFSGMTLAIIFLTVFIFACQKEVASSPNFIFKPAPKQGVVANIAGNDIVAEEFYKGIENDIYEAEMKVYDLKMNRLRAMLLEKLMESDPRKKGLSNDQFLDKYISQGETPSKSDIENFIKERKLPKEHVNDQMKERIKQFLTVEMKKKAVENWLAKQTQKKPVVVYLEKPVRPVFDVPLGDAPFYGKADAKVTLVEFSDFQCPFCAKGAAIINQIKAKYGTKVKIVFKQFPLPFHNHAQKAAEASLCANEQETKYFWKLHDLMFNDPAKLDLENLKKSAKNVGLDEKKFNECLTSNKYEGKVASEMEEGKNIGVKSTPTFFVNGKIINGAHPIEVFQELIDEELAK